MNTTIDAFQFPRQFACGTQTIRGEQEMVRTEPLDAISRSFEYTLRLLNKDLQWYEQEDLLFALGVAKAGATAHS